MRDMYNMLCEVMETTSELTGLRSWAFRDDRDMETNIAELKRTEQEIPFGLAFDLAMEGHVIRRATDTYGFTISEATNGCTSEDGEPGYLAWQCDENHNPTQTNRWFQPEDLLATDYVVIK